MISLKNLHLLISIVVVVPAAFIYGWDPANVLPTFFDFSAETTDQKNIFRALMIFYLTISAFWIIGIVRRDYWHAASLSNFVFMGGLGIGRLFSIIVDGTPSALFSIGTYGELILALYAAYQLRLYNIENKKTH
ncbi:MAG: DUF4345 domain-containing protein [Flavobacteriaceae bacterium]|nr:DUF4345 domain-containing protein [Flavobacteriaceae bacterium]